MRMHVKDEEPPTIAMLTLSVPHEQTAEAMAQECVQPVQPMLCVSSDGIGQAGARAAEDLERPIDLSSHVVGPTSGPNHPQQLKDEQYS